jgi:hypothetical protein
MPELDMKQAICQGRLTTVNEPLSMDTERKLLVARIGCMRYPLPAGIQRMIDFYTKRVFEQHVFMMVCARTLPTDLLRLLLEFV